MKFSGLLKREKCEVDFHASCWAENMHGEPLRTIWRNILSLDYEVNKEDFFFLEEEGI